MSGRGLMRAGSLLLHRHNGSVAEHDLRRRGIAVPSILARNHGVAVIGCHRALPGLWRKEAEIQIGDCAGLSLSASGSFRFTMKSGTLACLASSVTAILMTDAVASIDGSGNGRGLILQQRPELVSIFLGAEGEDQFLVRQGQGVQVRAYWPGSCGSFPGRCVGRCNGT